MAQHDSQAPCLADLVSALDYRARCRLHFDEVALTLLGSSMHTVERRTRREEGGVVAGTSGGRREEKPFGTQSLFPFRESRLGGARRRPRTFSTRRSG